MNMVLSDVEETIYLVDSDEQTGQDVVRVRSLLVLLASARGHELTRTTAHRPSSATATCSLSVETALSSCVSLSPPPRRVNETNGMRMQKATILLSTDTAPPPSRSLPRRGDPADAAAEPNDTLLDRPLLPGYPLLPRVRTL